MDLVEQVELDPSLDDQEARVVPSRHTGKSVIDHIDTYGIPKETALGLSRIIGVFTPTLTLFQSWDLQPIHKNRRQDVD